MLVALVLTVARKMLDGGGHPQRLHALHISLAHPRHAFGVGTKGAGVCDRVAEIGINVNNGGKGPVRADCLRFLCARLRHLCRHLRIIRRGDFHRSANQRSFLHDAVSALFQIGGNQQRNFAARLKRLRCGHGALSRNDAVHTSAGLQNAVNIIKFFGLSLFKQNAKQLADLFLHGHLRKRVVHPRNRFIVQKKRIRFQINHL